MRVARWGLHKGTGIARHRALTASAGLTVLFLAGHDPALAGPFEMLPSDTSASTASAPAPFAMRAADIETVYDGSSSAGSASLSTSDGEAVVFRDSATASSAETVNNGGETRFEDMSTAASSALTANESGRIRFQDSATAADARIVVNEGGSAGFSDTATAGSAFITSNGDTRFSGSSSADNAQITVNGTGTLVLEDSAAGGIARIANSGLTLLRDDASLGGALVTNNRTGTLTFEDRASGGSTAFIANSGGVTFNDTSTLGSAALTNNRTGSVLFTDRASAGDGFVSNSGAMVFAGFSTAARAEIVGNLGGTLLFQDRSSAGSAEISGAAEIAFTDRATAARAVISMAPGSTISFADRADGGRASLQLDNGAALDISAASGTVGLGTVSGAGSVYLGGRVLAVGDDTPLVNFDGTIADGGAAGGSGGGLVKRGTGTLNLSGRSTYTGETGVTAGVLEAGRANAFAARSDFTIGRNATLALADFDQTIGSLAGSGTVDLVSATLTTGNSTSTSFSGIITGMGGLTKTGSGTMRLTGVSDYSGLTRVSDGVLAVDGSIAASDVLVSGSATLTGTGIVGSATVSGALLASTAGTFSVAGDLTLNPSGTLALELAGGRSGLVAVGGDVFINGSLDLRTGSGVAPGDTVFLTSAGSISGSFDTIRSSYAFLDPSVIYGDSTLTLRLERNAVGFFEVAASRNQRATARAVEALGDGNVLHDEVLLLDAAQARAGFDSLSGEIHADALDAAGLLATGQRRSVLARLRDEDAPAGLWGDAAYLRIDRQGDGNAAALRLAGRVFAGGLDAAPSPDLRLGLAGFQTRADLSNAARRSSGDIESIGLTAYARWQAGPWRVRGGAQAARLDTSLSRDIAVGTLRETARSDYGGWSAGAFGELDYATMFNGFDVEPYLGLSWQTARRNGFSETGAGDTNLSGGSASLSRSDAEIGLRISRAWQLDGGVTLRPALELAYGRRLAGDAAASPHSFAGGMPFTIYGVGGSENAGSVEARLDVDFGSSLEAALFYRGDFTERDRSHSVGAGLRVGF